MSLGQQPQVTPVMSIILQPSSSRCKSHKPRGPVNTTKGLRQGASGQGANQGHQAATPEVGGGCRPTATPQHPGTAVSTGHRHAPSRGSQVRPGRATQRSSSASLPARPGCRHSSTSTCRAHGPTNPPVRPCGISVSQGSHITTREPQSRQATR
ncbi:hypothetical protein NDU88_004540 [Pleurodeles waltl]|uniref:Uncharacterized protein n=1 Tax=Pleurodeles waltl TaxID=8319 RepID=A0AAV7PFJ1_PLEWA|nr:hypothetical protein NDU88_004540 [Pleurodeles waltl]